MLVALALACSAPPPPPPPPPAPTVIQPADVPWQWDYTVPDYSNTVKTRFDMDYVIFARNADLQGTVSRETRDGVVKWSIPLEAGTNRASILSEFDGVFVASWHVKRPGAGLSRLDPETGATLWRAAIAGAEGPPPEHGFNRVQPWRWQDWMVVYEDDSNGHYIEVLDPSTGASLYHRTEAVP